MPTLLACPVCQGQVSSAAPHCPRCGQPIAAPLVAAHVQVPHVYAPPQPQAPSRFACPRCQSEQASRLPLLWQDGINALNLTTASLGRGGAGVAFTGGTSQTASSSQAAPPQRRDPSTAHGWTFLGGPLVGLAIWLFLGISWYSAVPGLLVGGLISFVSFRSWQAIREWNRVEFPKLYHLWENTYRCNRCGEVYLAT